MHNLYMQHNQNTKQGKQKEWLTEHTNCAVEISVMLMLKGNQTEDTSILTTGSPAQMVWRRHIKLYSGKRSFTSCLVAVGGVHVWVIGNLVRT